MDSLPTRSTLRPIVKVRLMQSPVFICFFVVALLSPIAEAKRVKLDIGSVAPTWKSIPGVDGNEHSFDELIKAKPKAIAIVFTCNDCPVAKSYVGRINKIQADYEKQGLIVVAINPNKGKSESLKAMKLHAKKQKIKHAYLRDERQQVAKSYGALLTPEVFLLTPDRKIAYKGAIDDDRKMKGKATKRSYLREAIESVLAGKPVKTRETRATGCAIRWK